MNKKEWKAHQNLKMRMETYEAASNFFANDAVLRAAGIPYWDGVEEIIESLFDQILKDLETVAENLGKDENGY